MMFTTILMTLSSATSMEEEKLFIIWQTYINHDDTFMIPFILPFVFWLLCYIDYTYRRQLLFHKWILIHNIHNFGAILLGTISLYWNNDHIFSERIPILWSLSYFIIDLYDCISRYDITYTLHAVFCIGLGLCNYHTILFRTLRMNSKATYLELSNPVMHLAKRTRQPFHFLLFAITFTLCRIVWIPILYYQLLQHLSLYDIRLLILCAFYMLNVYWYYKIILILYNGVRSHPKEDIKND